MDASYGLTQFPPSARTLQFGFTLVAFWGIYGFLPESLIFILYFVVTPYLPPGLEPVSSWPFIQDNQMIMFNTAHIFLILALIQYFIYRGSPIKFISVTEYPGNLLGFLTLSLASRFVFRMSYLFILDRWDGNGCHSLVCCSEEKTVSVNDPAAVAQASELWLFFVWRTIGEVAKGAIMVIHHHPRVRTVSLPDILRATPPMYPLWWLNMKYTPLGLTLPVALLDMCRLLVTCFQLFLKKNISGVLWSILLLPELLMALAPLYYGFDKCHLPVILLLNMPALLFTAMACVDYYRKFMRSAYLRIAQKARPLRHVRLLRTVGNAWAALAKHPIMVKWLPPLFRVRANSNSEIQILQRLRDTVASINSHSNFTGFGGMSTRLREPFNARHGWAVIYAYCSQMWKFSKIRFRDLGPQWVDVRSNKLELTQELGRGAYGVVFAGHWRGLEVAVKQFEIPKTDPVFLAELLWGFKEEVALLHKLPHPAIVQFIGATLDPPRIILERSPGNLDDFLYHPSGPIMRGQVKMSPSRAVRIALSLASAMNYLHTHNPPILHMDLKPANLLMFDHHSCKLSDFGLARFKLDHQLSGFSLRIGTTQYSAPEVMNNQVNLVGEAADMYSFAVVLWELLALKRPWEGLLESQIMYNVAEAHKRPEIPSEVGPELQEVLELAWHRDPNKRPSFAEISGMLIDALRGSSGEQTRFRSKLASTSSM